MAMEVTTKVEEGYQAVVLFVLAKNGNGVPITPGQKEAVEGAAKSALELVGAEVQAGSSAMMFAPVDLGKYAILKMTVETHDDPNASGMIEVEDEPTEEPTVTYKNAAIGLEEAYEDEPTPEVEEPEPDGTEEPTETEAE